MKYDFIIIGSGIVGLTLAFKLKKRLKQSKILILEKEIKSKMLFDDLKKRMKTAYQKKKRQDKINDLNSRPSSWEGLI